MQSRPSSPRNSCLLQWVSTISEKVQLVNVDRNQNIVRARCWEDTSENPNMNRNGLISVRTTSDCLYKVMFMLRCSHSHKMQKVKYRIYKIMMLDGFFFAKAFKKKKKTMSLRFNFLTSRYSMSLMIKLMNIRRNIYTSLTMTQKCADPSG